MKVKINERDIYLNIMHNDLFPMVHEVQTDRFHVPHSWFTQPVASWEETVAGGVTGAQPYPSTRSNGRLGLLSSADTMGAAASRLIANYLHCDSNGLITTCDLEPDVLALHRVSGQGWSVPFTDWNSSMRCVASVKEVKDGSSFVVTIPYPVVAMNSGDHDGGTGIMGHEITANAGEIGLKGAAYPTSIFEDPPETTKVALGVAYKDYSGSNTADRLERPSPYKDTSIYSVTMSPGNWRKWKDGGGFYHDMQTDKEGNSTGKEKHKTVDKCLTRDGFSGGLALGLGRSWFRTSSEEDHELSSLGKNPERAFELACQQSISALFYNIDVAAVSLVIAYNGGSDVVSTIDGDDYTLNDVMTGNRQVKPDDPLGNRRALQKFRSNGNLPMISNTNLIRGRLEGKLRAEVSASQSDFANRSPNDVVLTSGGFMKVDAGVGHLFSRIPQEASTNDMPYTSQNVFISLEDETVGVAPIIRPNDYQKGVDRWNGNLRIHACPVGRLVKVNGVQGVSVPHGVNIPLRTTDGSVGPITPLSSFKKMSYFLRGHALGAVLPTLTPLSEDAIPWVGSYMKGNLSGLRGADVISNIPGLANLMSETSVTPTFFSAPGLGKITNYKYKKGGS